MGKKIKPGLVTDRYGKILGRHPGTCYFTIGQRKGLGIPFGRPLYIVDIKHRLGHIIVGEYKDTLKRRLNAVNVDWMTRVDLTKPLNAKAKIRYKHPKSKATVTALPKNRCTVSFSRPQSSPTPGQAVVFYSKDAVLGGGWIKKVHN